MIALAIAVLLAQQPLLKWTDKKGGVHYTNDPAAVPKGVKPVPLKLDELEYLYTADKPPEAEDPDAEQREKVKQLTHAERRAKISERRAEIRKLLQEFAAVRHDLDVMPEVERARCYPQPAVVPAECKELVDRVTQSTLSALGATLPYVELNLYEQAEGLEPTPRPPALHYLPPPLPRKKPRPCNVDTQRKELEAYLARRKAELGKGDAFAADGAKFGVEVATDHLRNLDAGCPAK